MHGKSRNLLLDCPGIVTAAASGRMDLNNFVEAKTELFRLLRENKSKHIPITSLSTHGITAQCAHSGLSMEIWNNSEGAYVSAGTHAKIEAAALSQSKINEQYQTILNNKFCFTDQLDQLGQIAGEESHIAIVHIDGNSMGKRFKAMKTLEDMRKLSMTVDGRLGIYLAGIFIASLEEKEVSDKKSLTACAGISITKSKYPFYRGYRLAEELCRHAKTVRHDNGDSFSYIDFHVSSGGFSGSLDTIREKHFRVHERSLLCRPYRLSSDGNDELGFETLVRNTAKLKNNFPNNKIKELRHVLTLSEKAGVRFVNEMRYRGRALPEMPGRTYSESLFDNEKTPYLDMIELMEFYPDYELFPDGGSK
ncbi:MAG: hypothetical protein B6I30_09825 [Desulfobacteraceae bacterium 4572_187]|nr:MAG: hypothetical protein B6I30_09825 [Desulfobacteraceae bacterium 4572_187]